MKKIFAGFIFLICFLGFNNIVFAENEYVILGGDSIGLKFSTGVIVSGKYKVETEIGKVKPWEKSDISVGDKIIEIDNIIIKKYINKKEPFLRLFFYVFVFSSETDFGSVNKIFHILSVSYPDYDSNK